MDIIVYKLRNVDVVESRDGREVTVKLTEIDGSWYGRQTEIKMPAKSFEMLEEAIVENWLEKKKSLISE